MQVTVLETPTSVRDVRDFPTEGFPMLTKEKFVHNASYDANSSVDHHSIASKTPPHTPPRWFLVSLLTGCQIANAGWCVVGSHALTNTTGISAPLFVALRMVGSVIVLALAATGIEGHTVLRTAPWRPGTPLWRQPLLGAGAVGGGAMPLLYLQGLTRTSPTVAAVWDGALLPVAVCLIAWLVQGTRHTQRQWGSLCVTAVAAAIVVLTEHSHHMRQQEVSESSTFLYGNLFLLAMVLCAATMNLSQQAVSTFYPHPISLTCWMFIVGGSLHITNAILTALLWPPKATTAIHVDRWFIAALLYAAVLLPVSFTTVSYASRFLDASVITLFCALQPCLTALPNWHRMTLTQGVGIAFVLFGMYGFTSAAEGQHRRNEAEHAHAV